MAKIQKKLDTRKNLFQRAINFISKPFPSKQEEIASEEKHKHRIPSTNTRLSSGPTSRHTCSWRSSSSAPRHRSVTAATSASSRAATSAATCDARRCPNARPHCPFCCWPTPPPPHKIPGQQGSYLGVQFLGFADPPQKPSTLIILGNRQKLSQKCQFYHLKNG